jgi:hypothetical protein
VSIHSIQNGCKTLFPSGSSPVVSVRRVNLFDEISMDRLVLVLIIVIILSLLIG